MPKRYPIIETKVLVDKDTVYQIKVPAVVQGFTLKTRGNHELRVAYKEGDIENSIYVTIPSGASLSEDDLHPESDITIYVQCPEVNSEILEIYYWR